MIATAMGMITQDFDDAALTDTVMAAFAKHAFQLLAHGLELGDADFDLCQM